MYVSGQFNNLLNRMHQLPTGISDLNTFLLEGSGYMPFTSTGYAYALSKETRKKFDIFGSPQTGNYLV